MVTHLISGHILYLYNTVTQKKNATLETENIKAPNPMVRRSRVNLWWENRSSREINLTNIQNTKHFFGKVGKGMTATITSGLLCSSQWSAHQPFPVCKLRPSVDAGGLKEDRKNMALLLWVRSGVFDVIRN